jgi:hypothetical protein
VRLRIWLLAAAAVGACGDDDAGAKPDAGGLPIDASSSLDATHPEAAPDADVSPSDCFLNPTTYLEIINACTDAEKVTKTPVLRLLGADGKLPPLP